MIDAYQRILSRFANFAEATLKTAKTDPKLKYYGVGSSSHWAVQSNMNVCAALAILGDEKSVDTALSLFRYAMRTHKSGDLACTDEQSWGASWISVLGAERMTHGINALEPFFTENDHKMYRDFRIYESDWILNDYEIVADMLGASGKNKPESNIWNGGFLLRTALDYPDAPNNRAYWEKGVKFLLNGISHVTDAASEEKFLGRPLRELHEGFNFTPNWSLDHHNYMNVGYSYICLSNIAMLYFNFKERNQPVPAAVMHHAEDLWRVVKHFIFPDGRMLRIGGDSRARYTYCQAYLIPSLLLAIDAFNDTDAAVYERNYLKLLEKEQLDNPGGEFFRKRLKSVEDLSYFYYVRLESDPPLALSCGLHWRRKFKMPEPAATPASILYETPYFWKDEFHGAALLKNDRTIRSFVQKGASTPVLLCLPATRSDLAEWMANGFSRFEMNNTRYSCEESKICRCDSGAFAVFCSGFWREVAPYGEGEAPANVVRSFYATAALPDGQSMVTIEYSKTLKDMTFRRIFKSAFSIPNDVYNDYMRTYRGESFEFDAHALPSEDRIVQTDSKNLIVDNVLALSLPDNAPENTDWTINRFRERRAGITSSDRIMKTLAIDEICAGTHVDFNRFETGTVVTDSATLITANSGGVTPLKGSITVQDGMLRIVSVRGADGIDYTVTANFDAQPALWRGETFAPFSVTIK